MKIAMVDKPGRPRVIWPMLPAGKPVDDAIENLNPLLEKGSRDHYPAGRIMISRGNISWLLDRAAADGLKAAEQ